MEELDRLMLSIVDLCTALTLLYIYHKLGQKKLRAIRRDKKLAMANLIQNQSGFLQTDDSVFNRLQPFESQEHIVDRNSSVISENDQRGHKVKGCSRQQDQNEKHNGTYDMESSISSSEIDKDFKSEIQSHRLNMHEV